MTFIRQHRPGHRAFIAPMHNFRRPSVNAAPQSHALRDPAQTSPASKGMLGDKEASL